MSSRKLISSAAFALVIALPLALFAASAGTTSQLTSAEIVEKNVAARGGLAAWHAVHTMSMSGKMDAGGTQHVQLPFSMELKRGRKSRFEIQFQGQTAVQVYDGVNGWMVRPFLNRRDVEPYSPDQLKQAAAQSDLDGLLIDYAAKGEKISLEGIEKVEDQDAYKLNVTMKNGQSRHVWVDAQTFLEVRIEGSPRRLDGKFHPVSTYLRDYRTVQGIKLPFLLETAVEGVKQREKIVVENVSVNPALADSLFMKPTP